MIEEWRRNFIRIHKPHFPEATLCEQRTAYNRLQPSAAGAMLTRRAAEAAALILRLN